VILLSIEFLNSLLSTLPILKSNISIFVLVLKARFNVIPWDFAVFFEDLADKFTREGNRKIREINVTAEGIIFIIIWFIFLTFTYEFIFSNEWNIIKGVFIPLISMNIVDFVIFLLNFLSKRCWYWFLVKLRRRSQNLRWRYVFFTWFKIFNKPKYTILTSNLNAHILDIAGC